MWGDVERKDGSAKEDLRWKKPQGEVDGRLGTHRIIRWRIGLLSYGGDLR